MMLDRAAYCEKLKNGDGEIFKQEQEMDQNMIIDAQEMDQKLENDNRCTL